MRNTLEDLYYGNITPGAQQITPKSELMRATDRVTRFESQLTERLDEDGQTVLAKLVESHDLRHTFSTVALEHGMDVKTLSTVIGHVSSSTTLNVYAHVTYEMRRIAAIKIDRGIGKADPQEIETASRKLIPSTFQARKGQRRKAGTGCVTQINEKLWEGRYSPRLAERQKARPQRLRPQRGGMRKTAGGSDRRDESGDPHGKGTAENEPQGRLI